MLGEMATAAQAAAKTAYCDACKATNAADCDGFFSIDVAAGKAGVGYEVLLSSDDLVAKAQMDRASKCDPIEYGICVALVSCARSGGDFCSDGGFCAPK